MSFDEKFRNGHWNFAASRSSELVDVVEKHLGSGALLVMGCGTGSLIGALKPESFSSVLGIDMSAEAITRAREHTARNVVFEQGDILKYESDKKFSVILFSESLYYIKPWRRRGLLSKLRRNLEPEGTFIVTIAQPSRYAGIIRMIRRNFQVLEDRRFTNSERHLIVFR
jgi:trans-aconitate methyltransferase